jgi:large subunit ribosomal protein L10
MSKLVKQLVTQELTARYAQQTSAVWVELTGVDGIATNALRRELRARRMRLEIVKNALLRRACAGGPLARLADAITGPAALITGGESATAIGKLLAEWHPKLQGLKVHAALVEGEFLDEKAVQGLALMPSRRDLQARVVAILCSPGANLAALLLSGGGNIAGCLKSLVEKLEKAETPAA